MKETGKLFGFASTSGIELGEAEPVFATTDAVRSAIGYGHSFTPLQISRYATTLATRGKLYKYSLIKQITDKDGVILKSMTPVIESEITKLNNAAWNTIATGMKNVVLKSSYSFIEAYADIPVSVAGKTGSAQQGANKAPHAVFVSFAPVEKPETSVTVVVANGYSGNNAGLLCRDIYAYYYNGEFREFLSKVSEEGAIP